MRSIVLALINLAFWALVILAFCTPVFGEAWCKCSGLRLFVGDEPDPDGDRPWTTIGVAWYGLPGSAGWCKIEGA